MNSIEKYLQGKGLSQATITCYHNEIMEFIVWCDMQRIDPETAGSTDITAYLKHLQTKGQQNNTRRTNLGILKHYFDYLICQEKRSDHPAQHIKIRGAKRRTLYPIFSVQELETLYGSYKLREATDSCNNRNWFYNAVLSRERNKAILGLIIYQGLTTDEVNRLSINDMKLKEGKVFISGTRKSNERELELRSHQVMELMEYQVTTRRALLALRGEIGVSPLYFLPVRIAPGQQEVNGSGINIWKGLSKELKAGNKKFINFQQVRASVITHWLKQYNLRQVQYMAGHRYVSSTESYLINNIEDLQNDIDHYHPIG